MPKQICSASCFPWHCVTKRSFRKSMDLLSRYYGNQRPQMVSNGLTEVHWDTGRFFSGNSVHESFHLQLLRQPAFFGSFLHFFSCCTGLSPTRGILLALLLCLTSVKMTTGLSLNSPKSYTEALLYSQKVSSLFLLALPCPSATYSNTKRTANIVRDFIS